MSDESYPSTAIPMSPGQIRSLEEGFRNAGDIETADDIRRRFPQAFPSR